MRVPVRLLVLVSVLLLTLLGGCSSYPLGMNEKEWKALPPEKRAELLKLDAQQKHAERLARLKAEAEMARAEAEKEKARQQALARLYSRLRYGQVLRLSLEGGEGYFYRYRPIVPDSWLLTIGTIEQLAVRSQRNDTLKLWARYSPGKLLLCSDRPKGDDYDPRACAVLVDHYWDRGERRRITVPRRWDSKRPLLRNVTVWVRYPPVRSRHCD